MEVSEGRGLKNAEAENASLKKLMIEVLPELEALKVLPQGSFEPASRPLNDGGDLREGQYR